MKMKKKMPTIIAAACAAALIGCGAGGSSVDPYDGSDTDSFYTESDHVESNPAGSSLDENDTISQIVPIVPPDTESVPRRRTMCLSKMGLNSPTASTSGSTIRSL